MRRLPAGLRSARPSSVLLAILLFLPTTVGAQAKSPARPAPDTSPLARYAPRDNLLMYAELEGIDAHDETWRKTAAFKMLNETTLGAMLEDIGAQLAAHYLARRADKRVTGADAVAILRHLAHSGFVFAINPDPADSKKGSSVLVVRAGARKDVRSLFSRLVLSLGGPDTKPELSKIGERSVVLMKNTKTGRRWAWWAEKDDLVLGIDSPEITAEVIDGKRPNALEQPTRIDLFKAENGFQPLGVAFLDTTKTRESAASAFFRKVSIQGVKRLDYRWGFADDALMSFSRVVAPRPRQGMLALFDQPSFRRTDLPSLPEGIGGFSILSINPAKTFDTISAVAKGLGPGFGGTVDRAVETLRTKGRLQLRKDVLAPLGPKVAIYVAPGVSSSKPAAEKGAAPKPEAAPGLGAGNPLGMMMGTAQIPRLTLLLDVAEPVVFGRTIDSLVIFANQQFRARPAVSPDGPDADGSAAATPPGGSRPSGASERRPGEGLPSPEFRRMPGAAKAFVFHLPSELGKLPPGLRPTLRLGTKQLSVSTSPEAARQALEIKKGESWTLPVELSTPFEQLPSGLVFLNVNDPRETMPRLLASLPGTLQMAINSAVAQSQARAGGAPVAATPNPIPGSPPGSQGGSGPGSSGSSGVRDTASIPQAPNTGGPPGFPNAPLGGSAGPPGGGAPRSLPEGTIQIQVDPTKLPDAEALKALLFSGTSAVASDDQEIRFVSRVAFPNLMVPMSAAVYAAIYPTLHKAGMGAALGTPGQVPAASGAPAGPAKPNVPPSREPPGSRSRDD